MLRYGGNKLIVEKVKAQNVVLLLLLFLLFQLCFSLVLSDLYVFEKASLEADLVYTFHHVRFFIVSIVVLFSLILTLVIRTKGFLYIILVLILIFFVFPSAILFANIQNLDYRIFLSHELFFLVVLAFGKIKIKIASKTIDIYSSRKLLLYITLVGIVPFIILYLPHINFKNFFFKEIYETRALMTAKVNNLYTNYTYSWFNKIIIPALFIYGFYLKKRSTVLFSAILLIFLFLCGAHKTVFVGLFMVVVLYKFDYRRKSNYLIKFILLTALGSLALSLIFDNNLAMVMTIRRAIFLPALLDVLYFDLFDGNHLYWSEVFNGLIIEYPYKHPHAFIVGEVYFKNIIWGANNGIISDGFMNFGMIGVIINILIMGLYFSILNQLNISGKFFGIIFLFVFSLISSSLTTVLLTHGGIILLILAFFILKDTRKQML